MRRWIPMPSIRLEHSDREWSQIFDFIVTRDGENLANGVYVSLSLSLLVNTDESSQELPAPT